MRSVSVAANEVVHETKPFQAVIGLEEASHIGPCIPSSSGSDFPGRTATSYRLAWDSKSLFMGAILGATVPVDLLKCRLFMRIWTRF
jgi:hypothetical protein